MVKIVLRPGESVQEAVRRFRKIVERSGLKREVRRRERESPRNGMGHALFHLTHP
jgi:ribosomal protein S21